MKRSFKTIAALAMAGVALVSCTDKVTFGSEFIDKAPGGTLNLDSVFANPEYVNQLLTNIYNRQYYGLPYKHDGVNSHDHYVGKLDAVTDLYQQHWTGMRVHSGYYTGNLTDRDWALIAFSGEQVWESVYEACLIKENIDRCESMDTKTRNYIVAQATALQAFAYSVLLPHYGGLPLVNQTLTATTDEIGPRKTFEETVDFIVGLCDEAINSNALYWAYNGNDTDSNMTNMGRWTKAGVMALKAQVLWLAASPLFNSDQPYYDGTTEAETQHLVWYGDYKKSRWERALMAFEDFWRENEANGNYYCLVKSPNKTPDGYRGAYRRGYINDGSPENIHWTKVANYYGTQGTYSWLNWNTWSVNRNNLSPSLEYIEMFGWADGKPFDREKDMKFKENIEHNNGSKWDVYTCLNGSGSNANDKLFYTYTAVRGGFKKEASRDPRLYENARVSGVPEKLDFNTEASVSSGNIMELWVGGQNAGDCVMGAQTGDLNENLTSYCPTGFAAYKYVLSQAEYWRDSDMHWNVLTIPDMILMYAECLAMNDKLPEAIDQVDLIRGRVGLDSMAKSSFKIPHSTKEEIVEQILKERACELGMTNARYIDMIRHKRTDWMTKQLHGMATYRMIKNAQNQWVRRNAPWFGDDKNSGMAEPSRFEYEIFELYQPVKRALWEYENDPNNLEVRKWLMSPFPHDEINKGYGLIQNPGW